MANLMINAAQDLVGGPEGPKKVTRPWYLFFQEVATLLMNIVINLTSQVTGTLPVGNGGTGATTLTAHNVLLGEGTSAVGFAAPGASGTVLTSNGAGSDPTFQAVSAGTVTTTGSPANGNLTKFSGATSITNGDLSGDVTTSGTLATTLKTAAKTRGITFAMDGGGSVLTTGVKADVYVPYTCTITAVTMLADQSGSVVVDIWKDILANYPPTVADTLIGGGGTKPTISSNTNSQDTTLTSWTTSISAGNTLRFNVDSCTSITRLNLTLTVTV